MKTRDLTRTALYTALVCVAAIIFRYVPATLIPYSILPLVVLLAGFVLGPRLGAWSMAIYVLLGLIGFPVFASAPFGGPAYVLKASFGFLLGYILAAYAVGKILKLSKQPGIVWSSIAVVVGIACIYLVGLPYMYLILNFYLHKPTAIFRVLELGFLPFIALDLIKGAAVIVLGRLLKTSLNSAGAVESSRN